MLFTDWSQNGVPVTKSTGLVRGVQRPVKGTTGTFNHAPVQDRGGGDSLFLPPSVRRNL